jgi:hypothetical protein
MNHLVFGEIVYSKHDTQWTGRCRLPTFAEYGREANGSLEEPDADLRQAIFRLDIQDYEGNGPLPEQENVFGYLMEQEPQVCRIVMTELLAMYRHHYGSWAWLRNRKSRAAKWVARWLLPPDYKTADDLRPVVRCTEVEISSASTRVYAFVAFYFETADYMEVEHGLSVVFHPQKGAIWGDASAIHEAIDGW